jgi:hypothetical protein
MFLTPDLLSTDFLRGKQRLGHFILAEAAFYDNDFKDISDTWAG